MNKKESFEEWRKGKAEQGVLLSPNDYRKDAWDHQRDKYEKLLAEKDKQLKKAREEFKRLLGDENGFNEIDEVFIYKWLKQFKESK